MPQIRKTNYRVRNIIKFSDVTASKTVPEMPVGVTATDTGDSADVCVLVERTVLALVSKIVMKVKQFQIFFSEYSKS